MREILFRGKRIDNGEWVEGNLFVSDTDGRTHILVGTRIITIEWEVYQETIGQFTGLTDKNGKRIFEGDIVIYDNSPYNAYCEPQKGVIAWRNGSLSFKYRPWTSVMYRPLCSDDFFSVKCEVIGNIHDNPDLLEVHND